MKKITFKTLPIPTEIRKATWKTENASDFALQLIHSSKNSQQTLVVIVQTMQQAEELKDDCLFFEGKAEIFPDSETLPYDPFSPQVDIISKRLSVLFHIKSAQIPIVIITIPTLMQRLCPREFLDANVLLFKNGDHIDREQFRLSLEHSGYTAVKNVLSPGEFATRGALFDLFPMGLSHPIRIDFFDNEIDSIRTFNPETQETIDSLTKISLLPAREFEYNKGALERFEKKFQASFGGDPTRSYIYNEVVKGNLPSGIEGYLPLFFENTATFFEYLPAQSTLITYPNLAHEALRYERLINERYERYRHDIERPLLPPLRLFLTVNALEGLVNQYPQIALEFKTQFQPSVNLDTLSQHLRKATFPLILSVATSGRREVLLDRLHEAGIQPKVIEQVYTAFQEPAPLFMITQPLHNGFRLHHPDLLFITENEFLGVKPSRYKAPGKVINIDNMLTSIDSLKKGDPIIHLTHGIGRYVGLDMIDNTELVVIQYKDNSKLYVPITALDQLSTYSGTAKENAPWHNLGSEQWSKARRKAAEKANDTAAELLDIYAKREAQIAKGIHFDREAYQEFSKSFPYETTPDQQQAIDAIVSDLQKGKMDRIICGDVGFGKTEVAMRAAFISVMNGYQVALLAPTTLLAEQHAQSFQDRFADWPVKISSLSRFRKSKETQEIIDRLASGQMDIVIGTHKLLSDSVKFTNLGLVIIDEEHRFGVKQKEKLKRLRAEVNFLTMTATPIPRTLNMGLSGLRSLSIIATPPENRIAVKTFVNEWSDELILEACMREFKRGGQVYFLHNAVKTIDDVHATLSELFPDISIGIAHGQMKETELEQVMLDFYHHKINLLLCTTIIESGIDIPNANTVIINRADRLGLAQLHQIRGRVGRSHHRAYCYLIIPEEAIMTEDAKKRIDAIMTTNTLGAGFMLANHDLEIRGAGELLGEAQSGEIHSIGFSLYMSLLSRAVELVKLGKKLDLDEPFHKETEINIGVPALISDRYIHDISTRLSYYKKIASSRDNHDLHRLQIELIDQFGLLPDPTKLLFKLAEIKLKAYAMNLNKIEASGDGVRIVFGEHAKINVDNLIRLIQEQPHFYQLQKQEVLRYKIPLATPELRINAIVKIIDKLNE